MKNIFLAALLSSAVVSPVLAADITIHDFAGHVIITEGNDGVEVLRAGEDPAKIQDRSGEITIDGGLTSRERAEACNGGGGLSWDLSFNDRKSEGDTRLNDYPKLHLRVPQGSNLTIRDSHLLLTSQIRLTEGDLEIGGCFDIELDAVETLSLAKSGSGDIDIGEVGALTLDKSGSGDLDIGQVGSFALEKSGSGDIEIDKAEGTGRIELSGSGDIEIGEFVGDLDVQRSGSGDFVIDDGDIGRLDIQSSGSGDVDVDADVGDAFIRASGASDVYIKSVSGMLEQRTSGAADVRRGDD